MKRAKKTDQTWRKQKSQPMRRKKAANFFLWLSRESLSTNTKIYLSLSPVVSIGGKEGF